jgi:hypothetical protein
MRGDRISSTVAEKLTHPVIECLFLSGNSGQVGLIPPSRLKTVIGQRLGVDPGQCFAKGCKQWVKDGLSEVNARRLGGSASWL